MKADIYSIDGKKIKQIALPQQFDEPVRTDLIKRAVTALQSKKIQPYGTASRAGMRASADISKRRRRYKTTYGRGQSRTPRKVLNVRGSQFYFVGAFAPQTRGGRRAHPPKPGKIWLNKINRKERLKAIRSALAATSMKELVQQRGHRIDELKNVVESKVESITKTKDAQKFLISLGLEKELQRVSIKKVRAGKGKNRGRKYKRKTGPLLVVSKECPLQKAARGIEGVDICTPNQLNAELLAPGTVPGRLTIYTEDALKMLESQKLFMSKNEKSEVKK